VGDDDEMLAPKRPLVRLEHFSSDKFEIIRVSN